MSKPISITSKSQFDGLLMASRVVVTDFYADWCGPCKVIAPVYESLAEQLSRPNKVTFTKVNVDNQQDIAAAYGITAMPTFMVFKKGKPVTTVRGANQAALADAVKKLAAEADSDAGTGGFAEASGSGSSGSTWLGRAAPRGYGDVTDSVDVRGLDLLNADRAFGDARTLFNATKPAALAKGKGKGKADGKSADGSKDWVESDSDEQLMLFVPFNSRLRVHTLQLTSLPSTTADGDEEEEPPKRPRTVHLYTNSAHTLGFEEAESMAPTQAVTLRPDDWDAASGTASVELRFVKFQNVTSLVVFVVDGEEVEGGAERVRLDRVRVLGEVGEKRELGKLEKIGDAGGE